MEGREVEGQRRMEFEEEEEKIRHPGRKGSEGTETDGARQRKRGSR